MSPFSGRNGNLISKDGGFINVGGICFLHANRAAAATDIACQTQKLLNMDHFHALVAGGFCGLFQIQLAAHGNAKHMYAFFWSTGHKGLEDLLRWHTDGLCRMHTVQIVLVVFIKAFPEYVPFRQWISHYVKVKFMH